VVLTLLVGDLGTHGFPLHVISLVDLGVSQTNFKSLLLALFVLRQVELRSLVNQISFLLSDLGLIKVSLLLDIVHFRIRSCPDVSLVCRILSANLLSFNAHVLSELYELTLNLHLDKLSLLMDFLSVLSLHIFEEVVRRN